MNLRIESLLDFVSDKFQNYFIVYCQPAEEVNYGRVRIIETPPRQLAPNNHTNISNSSPTATGSSLPCPP